MSICSFLDVDPRYHTGDKNAAFGKSKGDATASLGIAHANNVAQMKDIRSPGSKRLATRQPTLPSSGTQARKDAAGFRFLEPIPSKKRGSRSEPSSPLGPLHLSTNRVLYWELDNYVLV